MSLIAEHTSSITQQNLGTWRHQAGEDQRGNVRCQPDPRRVSMGGQVVGIRVCRIPGTIVQTDLPGIGTPPPLSPV